MMQYPSISNIIDRNVLVHVFDKIDGTLIRAQFSMKRDRFYKFGTRSRLIDASEPVFGVSIPLIEGLAGRLAPVFNALDRISVTCFFELVGSSSFAGQHVPDDELSVTLLDVATHDGCLVPAGVFSPMFSGVVPIAHQIFVGAIDEATEGLIRRSELPGITFEGVVCKSMDGRMFKVKTDAWLQKLRERCGSDEAEFMKLS